MKLAPSSKKTRSSCFTAASSLPCNPQAASDEPGMISWYATILEDLSRFGR